MPAKKFRHDVVPDGSKRCTKCEMVKSLGAYPFNKSRKCWGSWCRACVRIAVGARAQTEERRKWQADYLARPDVRERRREAERKRRETHKASAKAYRSSPRGKLSHSRSAARAKLRAATDPARRARLQQLIESYTREIDRLARSVT